MEMKSLRQTYGETLVKLGKDNKNIISLMQTLENLQCLVPCSNWVMTDSLKWE